MTSSRINGKQDEGNRNAKGLVVIKERGIGKEINFINAKNVVQHIIVQDIVLKKIGMTKQVHIGIIVRNII